MYKFLVVLALVAFASAEFTKLKNFGQAGERLQNALEEVKRDPCYQQTAAKFAPTIIQVIEQAMTNSLNKRQAGDDVFGLIADFQESLKQCGNNAFNNLALTELPEDDGETDLFLVAELFLISSQCFQDIGGFLFVVDAVKNQPGNVAQDLILGFIAFVSAEKARQDCGVIPAVVHAIIDNGW